MMGCAKRPHMNRSCAVALFLLGISGCATASPWPHYEAAVRCHLDGRKSLCNEHYVRAIRINPQLQGIHASYGVHLLQQGQTAAAEREFALERMNYPAFSTMAIGRLAATAPADHLVPATPGAPAAPAAPATPGAPRPATVSTRSEVK